MVFILGGVSQGKYEFAKNIAKEDRRIHAHYEKIVKKQLQNESLNPISPIEEIERQIEIWKQSDEWKDMVIISEDMGSGIVPIDKFEREYREINGRVNCILAKEADEVYRVVCGIGMRIK